MARGIISCGFGDQDCKLLNFQIKNVNLCFFLLLHNSENVHSFETMRRRSRGADDTPRTCFALLYFFLIPSLTLTGASWTGEEVPGESHPTHHKPFGSTSITLSGPVGECSATKAAICNLSVCHAAKGFVVGFLLLNTYFPKQTG